MRREASSLDGVYLEDEQVVLIHPYITSSVNSDVIS